MDNSKNYWLILNEDSFGKKAIECLEGYDKKYAYSYMKLCLKVSRMDGILKRKTSEIFVPYDEKKLAQILDCDAKIIAEMVEILRGSRFIGVLTGDDVFVQELANLMMSQVGKTVEEPKWELKSDDELPQEETEQVIQSTNNTHEKHQQIREVVEAWNDMCMATGLKEISRLSSGSNRYKWISARIKEHGLEAVIQAIDNIKNSTFLQGDNKNGWTITFDWFARPNNFPKVYEGQYNDSAPNGNEEMSFEALIQEYENGGN